MLQQDIQNFDRKHTRSLRRTSFVVTACLMLSPLQVLAHQMTVFAAVQDETVEITAKFGDGSFVMSGTLQISGADDTLLLSQEVDGQWPVIFAIGDHTDGLRIEVDAGNGHSNYWILTPSDLAAKRTN